MKASIYFNYTSRSLWRGGQRTLLAIFCVAVGVMAIVSLQLVGLMINNAFAGNVRDANGGDIAVRSQNQPFAQSDLSFFNTLKKEGVINNYTPLINAQGTTGARVSLRETFDVRVVDAGNYPIVTPPTFTSPRDGTVASLLKHNQVIVTQSFIDQYRKKIGDSFDLHVGTRETGGRTIRARIVGIVTETGVLAQAGSVVLLSVNDYKAAAPQPTTTSTQQNATPTPQAQAPQRNGAPAQQSPPQQNGAPPQQNRGAPPQNGSVPPQRGAPPQQGATAPQVPAPPRDAVLYDTVNVVTSSGHIDRAVKRIQQQFPIASTQTANDALKQQQELIDNIKKFLEIAGLLALLIGGVGIVNTMQVLLSRRKTEIAMLKTTGYRRFDLYLLFGLEAGLLGLVGGIVGAGTAIAVSYLVRNQVQQTFGLNIPFLLDPFTIGGGVVIGLVTALIFGLLPIIQAANIRPLNVIRDLPEGRGVTSIALTGLLLVVLSVLFCILAIVILGNDVLLGAVSVYGAFAFLGLLSLIFGLIILLLSNLPVSERFSAGHLALLLGTAALAVAGWLYRDWFFRAVPALGILLVLLVALALLLFVVVVLPRTWKSNTRMALRNLGRQRARTTTTMLALFVGIFTIGLIFVLGQNLRTQVNNVISTSLNYNAFVITSNDDTTKLQNKLASIPGLASYQHRMLASTAPVSVNDKPIQALLPTGSGTQGSSSSSGRNSALYFLSGIEGYNVGNNQLPSKQYIQIVRGRNLRASDAGSDNVLISSQLANSGPLRLKLGDKVTLTGVDRLSLQTVTVVGVYRSTTLGGSLYPLLGTSDTAKALSPVGVTQSVFYMKIDPTRLNQAVNVIGTTVPNAFVLNLANISDFINQLLNDILLTLTTIASLTLLAGMIIIANAVALAMLERRRELGILKSVGYTSGSILSEVLLENGLIGGTGAIMAVLLISLVTSQLGRLVFKANFVVSSSAALGLVAGSAALAMIAAALVAWSAVRVRPLEVLRYE